METNDHDLLIELKTLTTIVVDNQNRLLERFEGLSSRVSVLELSDQRDSERIGSVIKAVEAATSNGTQIAQAHSRLDALQDDIADLKRKSTVLDAVNAVGVMVSGVIGVIFGSR